MKKKEDSEIMAKKIFDVLTKDEQDCLTKEFSINEININEPRYVINYLWMIHWSGTMCLGNAEMREKKIYEDLKDE